MSKYVGAHVSIAGGVENAPVNAREIGATAFGMFTKNQRRWSAAPYKKKNTEGFSENCKKHNYGKGQILPHDTYLINLSNPDRLKLEKSRKAFIDELKRCEQLGIDRLNFHPGSHLGKMSEEDALKLNAESLDIALSETSSVIAVVENTAGQGTNLGYRFEHIAKLIELVSDENRARMGFCFDTCHAFAAGYDLSSTKACEKTFKELDSVVGISFLKGMHLNDALKPVGSKLDRHAPLGKGEIGMSAFSYIMKDSRFDNIPLILETPDSSLWPREIEILKEFTGRRNSHE